jgi:GNAT superfamily N-acetyltransferase
VAYRPPEPLDAGHDLDDFSCEEPALNDWLRRYARIAQASGSARIYVATTVSAPKEVVGYYALAAASVSPDTATIRALKGQPQAQDVPAILLARLARDQRHALHGVGASLLQDALLRATGAADQIGARAVLVHAKHELAKAFYVKYGFEESPTDPLHLMLLMNDVRRYLGTLARTP